MSNTIDIKKAYLNSDFKSRYKSLVMQYDWRNPMKVGYKPRVHEIIQSSHHPFKYFKSESFYRLTEKIDNIEFTLDLTIRGFVETNFYCEYNNSTCIPAGRFDFILKELETTYEREKYALPLFDNIEEFMEIFSEILYIYENLKKEILNYLVSDKKHENQS